MKSIREDSLVHLLALLLNMAALVGIFQMLLVFKSWAVIVSNYALEMLILLRRNYFYKLIYSSRIPDCSFDILM